MKISKLFHWLYGLVMLLPIFAIMSTCLYAIFNDNARDSFSGTVSYKETVNITSMNEIISNRNYYSLEYLPRPAISTLYNITTLIIVDEDNNIVFNSENYNYSYFCIYTDAYFQIEGQETQYVDEIPVLSGRLIRISNQNVNITTMLFNSPKYSGNTGWLTSGNVLFDTYYVNTELNDAFYYGVESVENSVLFNWAKDSFLVAPFAYIATLFSMPTDSVIVMLLSYWLSISIIWLVFDLIMYLPLLVHRWLDKGIIE